jgi:recombination protein RecT
MSTQQRPAMLAKVEKPEWERPTNHAGLERLGKLVADKVNRALPRLMKGSADRLIRCMVTETQKTPALLDCTPASLFGGVIQAAQLGLAVGGPLGEAYFLPFGNSKKGVKEATLVIGYRGYVQLAHRSGMLRRLTPVVVREGDDFGFVRGTDQRLWHRPARGGEGAVTDYYVVAETVNGGTDFETFTRDEAIAFRDRYSTVRNAPPYVRDKSPWYDLAGGGFDSMALKTLIRRLAKRLPLSPEMGTAAGLDDRADHGEPQDLGDLVTAEVVEPADDGDPEHDGQLFHGGTDTSAIGR